MKENESILRGEIYWTKRKPHSPVVVVSNNDINETTDSVLVVPMTSNPTADLKTHCTIRVGGVSTALAERIRPMKKTDLGKFIDFTSVSEMMQLDFCLINALSLDYLFDELGQADRNTNAATEAVSPEVNNATMATTPEEEDKPIAVAIVEGESEPRVLHESEVIHSRSELNQIIDEALEASAKKVSQEEGKEWEIEDPDTYDLPIAHILDRCVELERELDRSKAREELLMKLYKELLEKKGG